jgi:hypothetical protein
MKTKITKKNLALFISFNNADIRSYKCPNGVGTKEPDNSSVLDYIHY